MERKDFILRCKRCDWIRYTDGFSKEVEDLHEYKKCSTCGGPRKFRCPDCGNMVKMIRLR